MLDLWYDKASWQHRECGVQTPPSMSASNRPAEASLSNNRAEQISSWLWSLTPKQQRTQWNRIFMSVLSNLACPYRTLSCRQQYSTDKAAATGHKQKKCDLPFSQHFTNLYIFQRDTHTKNILSAVVTFNIFFFPLSPLYSQWARKNCHLSSNQQGQTHSSMVSELFQRESSVILSAVSVSANAARHRFVTLADTLNLDTATTQTKSSLWSDEDVNKRMKQRPPYAIHTMYGLYNS